MADDGTSSHCVLFEESYEFAHGPADKPATERDIP